METKDDELQKICENLDELTLRQVDLLNEQLVLMSKLESHMSNGCINLAKSRYIGGESSVSRTQLPGEESDVKASTTLVKNPTSNRLEITRDPSAGDPIKWFGVLVPGSLRQSQQSFINILDTAVEIINIRNEWLETLEEKHKISSLKEKL